MLAGEVDAGNQPSLIAKLGVVSFSISSCVTAEQIVIEQLKLRERDGASRNLLLSDTETVFLVFLDF